jgi:phage terminase large subunit GpA
MPWQRLVADIGGEIDPVTGLPAYREVRVTVPRQSGKTTLFLAWQINRCVSRRWVHPQRSAFTAQTGKDARDKWVDELFPLIRNSALKSLVATTGARLSINEGMGNESIKFKTGSLIRLLSTATTSGHSKTLHQAVMDEVWHDVDDRREQGLRPAMITVPDAQLLVCSTAGTELSTVLNRKVETGRASVEADVGVGVAYFEWSAPDGWDPDDEPSYFSFMPALCPSPPCRCAGPGETWRHTITSLDAIRAERGAMETAEFKRAYGNVKTGRADAKWQVISEADWLDVLDDASQAVDPLVFAIDVTPERSHGSIAAAGARVDGDLHGEVVDHARGTSWLVSRAAELDARWKPAAWVVDAGGAAGFVIPSLESAGLNVVKMTSRNVGQAYGMFRSATSSAEQGIAPPSAEQLTGEPAGSLDEPVVVPKIRIRPGRHGAALTSAVEGAATRRVGDGTTWDRKATAVVISPLVAVTNAVFGFVTREVVEPDQPFFGAWR